MKTCAVCNTQFKPSKFTPLQKYCSGDCSNVEHNKRRSKNNGPFQRECLFCKEEFTTETYNKTYCKQNCQFAAERAKKYNLTNGEFQLLKSNTNCDICSSDITKDNNVDHSHDTGEVRGTLCSKCNLGLGHFKDDVSLLKKAVTYLKNDTDKKQMIDVMAASYKRGWISTRDGNISVRKNNLFYITKSAVDKGHLSLDDILVIDIINNELTLDGVKPSIELEMHWNLLKERECGSVLHLHPTHVISAMFAKNNIQQLSLEFPELSRYTRVGQTVPYFDPGSKELAKVTFENIKDYDIVGQDRHGVCAIADHPWAAYEHVERLDHVCEIVLKSGIKP